MAKAAQRQFLVKAPWFTGYMATKTGGDPSAESTKAWDGGTLKPDTLTAPAEYEDVTVGRPFDPDRDWDELRRLNKLVGRVAGDVTVIPTDADLVPVGKPLVYPDARLIGVTNPELDASSGDPATFELTFGVDDVG